MDKNNNKDFNTLITEWFDNTNKYFNDVFKDFKETEKYTKLLNAYNNLSNQISKDGAKKHINGLFDKLSEEEQQKIVDNVNAINSQFSKWFDIEPKKYTIEDLKGWKVDVDVEEDKKENTDKKEFENLNDVVAENNCSGEKCTCDKLEEKNKSVVDTLFDELDKTTTAEEYAAEVAAKVVEILSDKKNKNYKLYPKTKYEAPYVVVELELNEQFDKLETRTLQLIGDSIETTLGLVENHVYIEPIEGKRVKINIVLEKK